MYLAIDLGDKRCGIAKEIEKVIFPKNIVERHNLINELKKIFKNYAIEKIIVGLPYNNHLDNLSQLIKTEKFIEKLKNIFPEKEIIGFDERYTSEISKSILLKNPDKIKFIDDISASIILEDYFKYKNIYQEKSV